MRVLQPGKRVAIIGDSHMQALGPRLRTALPAATGVQLLRVEARPGWSVRGYVASGDVPALSRGADVVVIELGANDASNRIGPEAHGRDVQEMLAQVAPAQVIWVGPGVTERVDLESYRGPIRSVQKRVVESAGGVWIDAQPLTNKADLRADKVHYTIPGGYDRWTARLVPVLAAAGAPSSRAWLGPAILGSAALVAIGAWWWSRR